MPVIQLAQITAQAIKENTWNAINAVQEAPPGVGDIEFTFCRKVTWISGMPLLLRYLHSQSFWGWTLVVYFR